MICTANKLELYSTQIAIFLFLCPNQIVMDMELVYPRDSRFDPSSVIFSIRNTKIDAMHSPNVTVNGDEVVLRPGIMKSRESFQLQVGLRVRRGTNKFNLEKFHLRKITVSELQNSVVIETATDPKAIDWLKIREAMVTILGVTKAHLLAINRKPGSGQTQIIFCLYSTGTEIHDSRSQQTDLILSKWKQLEPALALKNVLLMHGKCKPLSTRVPCLTEIGYVDDVIAVSKSAFVSVSGSTMSVFVGLNLEWRARYITEDAKMRGCGPGSCLNGGVCRNSFNTDKFGFSCDCPKMANVELGPRCEITSIELRNTSYSRSLHDIPSFNGLFVMQFYHAMVDKPPIMPFLKLSIPTNKLVDDAQTLEISIIQISGYTLRMEMRSNTSTVAENYVGVMIMHGMMMIVTLTLDFVAEEYSLQICVWYTPRCDQASFRNIPRIPKIPRFLINSNSYVFQDAVLRYNYANETCIKNLRINGYLVDLKAGHSRNPIKCPMQAKNCHIHDLPIPASRKMACGDDSVCYVGYVPIACRCHCMSGYRKQYALTDFHEDDDLCEVLDLMPAVVGTCVKDNWFLNGLDATSDVHWAYMKNDMNRTGQDFFHDPSRTHMSQNQYRNAIKFSYRTLQSNFTLLYLKSSCNVKPAFALRINDKGFLRFSNGTCNRMFISSNIKANSGDLNKIEINFAEIVIPRASNIILFDAMVYINSTFALYCTGDSYTSIPMHYMRSVCLQLFPVFNLPKSCLHSVNYMVFYLPLIFPTSSMLSNSSFATDEVTASRLYRTGAHNFTEFIVPVGKSLKTSVGECLQFLPANCRDRCPDKNEERLLLWRQCPCVCKKGFIRDISTSNLCVPMTCKDFPYVVCPRLARCEVIDAKPTCVCSNANCSGRETFCECLPQASSTAPITSLVTTVFTSTDARSSIDRITTKRTSPTKTGSCDSSDPDCLTNLAKKPYGVNIRIAAAEYWPIVLVVSIVVLIGIILLIIGCYIKSRRNKEEDKTNSLEKVDESQQSDADKMTSTGSSTGDTVDDDRNDAASLVSSTSDDSQI